VRDERRPTGCQRARPDHAVFACLFGDGGSSAERLARTQKTSSILDSVREIEQRIQGKAV
jgi:hypothetical protein